MKEGNNTERSSGYPIAPWILNRWSPRSMSGEKVSESLLFTLFEAARWAPSSHNFQPWRFIYAYRDTPEWDSLFNLLVPANQIWAKQGAVLIVILSKAYHEGKYVRTHSFDTGAAWMALALQAYALDLIAHGIEGFDYERTKKELGIIEEYLVEAMAVIGKRGDKGNLPPNLQKTERPSDRKTLEAFVMKGRFTRKDSGS